MTKTAEPTSDVLQLHIRINPGNANLKEDDPDYEVQQAAFLDARRAKYVARFHAQAATGELEDLPEEDASRDLVIAAEAGRLANHDLDAVRILGGYGLGMEGIFITPDINITYVQDDTIPLGHHVIEGEHDPLEVFSRLRAALLE